MYISKALITERHEIEGYSKEELIDALKPVASVISKCETGMLSAQCGDVNYREMSIEDFRLWLEE